jgi:hypothetical protein
MDKDLAVHIAMTAYRASVDLGDLVPLLKEHCTEDEYKTLTRAIASASYTVNCEVTDLIFDMFPDIKDEFEGRLKKFGFVL